MDNLLVWTLVFAGATIGLLATFLIASERELKIKRREVNELIGQAGGRQTGDSPQLSTDPADPNGQTIAELTARNENLLEQVTSLADKLAAGQKMTAELDSALHRLADYESLQQQLQLENQRLQTDLAALQNQLQVAPARLEPSNDGAAPAAEDHSGSLAQLAELQHELDENRTRLGELENTRQRLHEAESREIAWKDTQQQLEQQTEKLKQELFARQQQISELGATQARLQEAERLHQKSGEENRRLQEKIASAQQRLAAADKNKQQMDSLRQRFSELQAMHTMIAERQHHFQTEMMAFAVALQTSEAASTSSSSEIPNASNDNILWLQPVPASPMVAAAGSSIELARDQINQRRYHDALANLDARLSEEPNDRAARLHHLLASIHLNGIQGYEEKIDCIKDMADLSEAERTTARDIFLLRADAAQKQGRDNEMLRYRAWARNVIYRMDATAANKQGGGVAPGATESDGDAIGHDAVNAAVDGGVVDPSSEIFPVRKHRFGIFSAIAVFATIGMTTVA